MSVFGFNNGLLIAYLILGVVCSLLPPLLWEIICLDIKSNQATTQVQGLCV